MVWPWWPPMIMSKSVWQVSEQFPNTKYPTELLWGGLWPEIKWWWDHQAVRWASHQFAMKVWLLLEPTRQLKSQSTAPHSEIFWHQMVSTWMRPHPPATRSYRTSVRSMNESWCLPENLGRWTISNRNNHSNCRCPQVKTTHHVCYDHHDWCTCYSRQVHTED